MVCGDSNAREAAPRMYVAGSTPLGLAGSINPTRLSVDCVQSETRTSSSLLDSGCEDVANVTGFAFLHAAGVGINSPPSSLGRGD